MKLQLHTCLWLGLAVAACDKPERPKPASGEDISPPRVTRTERPARDDTPDAARDLRAALTNAAEIESPEEREKALAKVAWDALELDPALAEEAMANLTPDSAERIRLIQHVAMRKAEEDGNEGLKWALTLGTDAERAAAVGHVALVLSDTAPARAAGLLSEFGIAGRGFNVVAVQVLNRWAAQSPADAAAWVAVFPPGQAREAGMRTVVSSWAEADAGAAFSWMATLPDEALRRETTLAMADALRQQPKDVRDERLSHADPQIRSEIEARWEAAKKETGHDDRSPSD